MVIIRHALADITITYREHEIEVPAVCPECTETLPERLREENWASSDFVFHLNGAGELISEDEEELHWDEFHPTALRCGWCAHELAAGDVLVQHVG